MRKVQIGQPLRLPASTFNTMLDTAQDYRNRSMTTRGHGLPLGSQNGVVTVRNDSGVDQNQFAVMGISGLVVNPADNMQEFFYRYALTVVTPTADHEGKFVILQEPIRDGGFGRAMIAGVTPVNILGDSSNQSKTAGISAGQTYLEPDGDGAQILWEAETSGSDEHLALVRFPFAAAPANTFAYTRINSSTLLAGCPVMPLAGTASCAADGTPQLTSPVDLPQAAYDGWPYFCVHSSYEPDAGGGILHGLASYPVDWFFGSVDAGLNGGGNIVAGECAGVLCGRSMYFVRGVYGARVLARVGAGSGYVSCLMIRDPLPPFIEATSDPSNNKQTVQAVPYNIGTAAPGGQDYSVYVAS